jgi:hypothetical protein
VSVVVFAQLARATLLHTTAMWPNGTRSWPTQPILLDTRPTYQARLGTKYLLAEGLAGANFAKRFKALSLFFLGHLG